MNATAREAAAFDRTGTWLALQSKDGVRLYDVRKPSAARLIETRPGCTFDTPRIAEASFETPSAFATDAHWLLLRCRHGAVVWDIERSREIWTGPYSVYQFAWLGRGRLIFSTFGPRGALGPTTLHLLDSGHESVIGEGWFENLQAAPGGERFSVVRLENCYPDCGRDAVALRRTIEIVKPSTAGSEWTRVPSQSVAIHSTTWSPSGHALAFGQLLLDADGRTRGRGRVTIAAYDLGKGTTTQLGSPAVDYTEDSSYGHGLLAQAYRIAWLGERPIALGSFDKADAQKSETLALGDNQLVARLGARRRTDLFLLAPGRQTSLTTWAEKGVERFRNDPARERAYVLERGRLWSVGLDGVPQEEPTSGRNVVDFARARIRQPQQVNSSAIGLIEADAGEWSYLLLNVVRPQQIFRARGAALVAVAPARGLAVVRLRNGEVVLTHGKDRSRLAVTEPRDVYVKKRVQYQAGGQQLTGWLIASDAKALSRPSPAVVIPYATRTWGLVTPEVDDLLLTDTPIDGREMLAMGFTLVLPSLPLGRFDRTDNLDLMASSLRSFLATPQVHAAVNPERLYVVGSSFGAFATVSLLSQMPCTFAGAVASAGVYDWVLAYNMRAAPQIEDGFAFGNPPEAGWADYIRNSPYFFADRIDAPLLLVQGAADGPLTRAEQSIALGARLRELGRSVTVRIYPGEEHSLRSPEHRRDANQLARLFLDNTLAPTCAKRPPS